MLDERSANVKSLRTSGTAMPSAALLEKGAKAVDLSKAGLTYRQIAAQMGCSVAMAHHYVVVTLRWSVGQAGADEVFWREVARLDDMTRAIWPDVLRGDLQAIDRALKISNRRAALYGLDAPTRIRIEQVSEEVIDHAIQERRTAIRLLEGAVRETG